MLLLFTNVISKILSLTKFNLIYNLVEIMNKMSIPHYMYTIKFKSVHVSNVSFHFP